MRRLRAERGWTLDESARRSGVSRRLIIQIEQGQANPRIGTLLRLADAFGVPLSVLLGEEPAIAYSIQRVGDVQELWTGERGGQGRLLVSHGPLELWSWELAPGESHESEPHRTGSWELLSVTTGALQIDVGPESFALGAGDSAWIDAAHAHGCRNSTSRGSAIHDGCSRTMRPRMIVAFRRCAQARDNWRQRHEFGSASA